MAWREQLHVNQLTADDLTVNDDMTVTDDFAVGGDLALTGVANYAAQGTLGTGSSEVTKSSDGYNFMTAITYTFTVDTAAAAALALGALIWTFPAGDIMINAASMIASATPTGAALDTDQPLIGVGTVVASGAAANLQGTATFDHIITETQVSAAFSGAVAKTAVFAFPSNLALLAAGTNTVFVNIADTWAAQDATLTLSGVVTLDWSLLTVA